MLPEKMTWRERLRTLRIIGSAMLDQKIWTLQCTIAAILSKQTWILRRIGATILDKKIWILRLATAMILTVTISAKAAGCECETCDDHHEMCIAHCEALGFSDAVFFCESQDGCAAYSTCDCRGYVQTTDPTGSDYSYE
ncbi:hypothetical protein HN358_02485 [Candidatus Uhrbacteria bacterium]|nr:hypothetical protein [Candidatus Uhrbacteria bacterium]MBT7717547.1 hypothetical protein [Candidatus Uhrbacteria bacterium]